MAGKQRSVEVVVRSDIDAGQISELVTRVGGLAGCRACGLVGIDLRLLGSDPAELEEHGLAKVPGVQSVVISER